MSFMGSMCHSASRDISLLNEDCWKSVLDQLSIEEVMRLRRVCTSWRDLADRYLQGVSGYVMFMPGSIVNISDSKSRVLSITGPRHLRNMLQNFGDRLARVTTNGDNQWMDEMAGNCPNLKELTLYHTFWNAEVLRLFASCDQLERVVLRGAKWVEDGFTYYTPNLKHIEIDRNERITGSFLDYTRTPLESLSLRECPLLQSYHLETNLHNLRNLNVLELDACPLQLLGSARRLIQQLPRLQELSFSHYNNARDHVEGLADSIGTLVDLRKLRLRRNDAVNDRFLEPIAKGCTRLHTLDVAGCNGSKTFKGVTVAGVASVAKNKSLVSVDISNLDALTDAVFEALRSCPLQTLRASNANIQEKSLYTCFRACKDLKFLDVRGCEAVTSKLLQEIAKVAPKRGRPLTLLAAATSFQYHELMIRVKGLTVRLDWPLDEPWERHHNNPDPEHEVFENYVDMDGYVSE